MKETSGMRALTADEIDNVAAGSGIIFAINPQFNVGIAAAISIAGNSVAILKQLNFHAGI